MVNEKSSTAQTDALVGLSLFLLAIKRSHEQYITPSAWVVIYLLDQSSSRLLSLFYFSLQHPYDFLLVFDCEVCTMHVLRLLLGLVQIVAEQRGLDAV